MMQTSAFFAEAIYPFPLCFSTKATLGSAQAIFSGPVTAPFATSPSLQKDCTNKEKVRMMEIGHRLFM